MKISDDCLKRLIEIVKTNTGQNIQERAETYSALLELAEYREEEQDEDADCFFYAVCNGQVYKCRTCGIQYFKYSGYAVMAEIIARNEYEMFPFDRFGKTAFIAREDAIAALQRDNTELEDE